MPTRKITFRLSLDDPLMVRLESIRDKWQTSLTDVILTQLYATNHVDRPTTSYDRRQAAQQRRRERERQGG
jgi:hypothetical protein